MDRHSINCMIEPRLETHDDAVNFVKDIFRSMGGTVLPPKRPRHLPKYTPLTVGRVDFMMDFENACLSQSWDSRIRAHPKGPNRHKDPDWAKMILSQVYPYHSEVDWKEYCSWVRSGLGDEWFQEDESGPEYDLNSKEGLEKMYTDMAVCGEAGCVQAEISENTRLKNLYEERLHLLVTRDSRLQLVREGAEHLCGNGFLE